MRGLPAITQHAILPTASVAQAAMGKGAKTPLRGYNARICPPYVCPAYSAATRAASSTGSTLAAHVEPALSAHLAATNTSVVISSLHDHDRGQAEGVRT